MNILREPTLLDLDDDVLCQILRSAYDVTGDDLPILHLGAGAKSELSLLSAAQTCQRLRQIVLHTLPTFVMARFKPVVRPGLSNDIKSKFGRGKDKTIVEPRPHHFTSATIVDIGSVQKPYGHLNWSATENSLENRCLDAAAVAVETKTFDALVKFRHLRGLDLGSMMVDTFRSLRTLESLIIDRSRALSEAALAALPYLTRLTSLDLMRANPNLDLFTKPSAYASTTPPRSVPVPAAARPIPSGTLQRQSMTAHVPGDRNTSAHSPVFSPGGGFMAARSPIFSPGGGFMTPRLRKPKGRAPEPAPEEAASPRDAPAEAPASPTADEAPALPPLPDLPPFPSLLQLRLSHLINSSVDSIRSFLERFPSLQALEMLHCEQATRASLAPVASMTALQRLRLHACPRVETLPNRSGLKPLVEVDLTACGARNDALEALAGCSEGNPGPELLKFYNCKKLTAATMPQEIDLSNLRGLSLAFCTQMLGEDLLAMVPYLHALQELSLEGCVHISGADATLIASGLPELLLLDLTSLSVHDGDLLVLKSLTALRALRMRRQVSFGAVARMAKESRAPVWPALMACGQNQRWIASASGAWAPFLSKLWKVPALA